jgi:two-component system, OmpR family, heavy metal sensor histidine kinase CusS
MKGLVEEIVDQHRFMDGGLKTTVKIDVMEGPVLCDPMRIRIILGNLVSNAFKYHDPAKEECVVEIKVYKDPGRCILSVTDNGIGMQAEVKERIFDRFYNTDAGNNMHSSGLGLYITRETVHMLNGSIEVESEPGQGSTFRVSIPVL